MIAALGGFLGRKGDGELGVKLLWIGLQRVASCVEGMRFGQNVGNGIGSAGLRKARILDPLTGIGEGGVNGYVSERSDSSLVPKNRISDA